VNHAPCDSARDLRLGLLQRRSSVILLAGGNRRLDALMKVRMRLTRAPLIAARLALRRMRFLACGVFAI
jgi:hypothetical protein